MPTSDQPAEADPDRHEQTEPDEHREVWTDAGARWDRKLRYAWWDGTTLLLYRKRLITTSVGGHAEMVVQRAADGTIRVITDPQRPNRALATRHDNAEQIHRWAAADIAALADRDQNSLQRKAQRIDPLDDLLRPLERLALQLTGPQRRALAIRVLQVLHL